MFLTTRSEELARRNARAAVSILQLASRLADLTLIFNVQLRMVGSQISHYDSNELLVEGTNGKQPGFVSLSQWV